jgi:uracil-DNA glycosylase family protein
MSARESRRVERTRDPAASRRDMIRKSSAAGAPVATGAESLAASWVHEGLARAGGGRPSLTGARAVAASCQACPLWRRATQTVFGEGARGAAVMLVGEQPGDQEDRAGHPFVGPAGRLLDEALSEAGIQREAAYVTNAVKHFKWIELEPRGKRRLHQKPNARELGACRPWLAAEIELVKPGVIVSLGTTAAQALLGRAIRLTDHRGRVVPAPWPMPVLVTVHPASILRAPQAAERQRQRLRFIDDLKAAKALLDARALKSS